MLCFGKLPHPSEYVLSENIDDHITRLLTSYSVDINHGFLPYPDPLHQLPLSSKFGCWEMIMMDLSQYLHAKNIRSIILSRLKIIAIEQDDLLDEREFQRALLILAVLSHAFVWGEKPVSTYIPACLAIPWVELTRRACRPPILTHALMVLTNWKRFDLEKPIELGNIGILNGFLSGTDEANFYLITVELEYRGAKALKHMLRAQYFASNENEKELINELKMIENIQKTILNTLAKMFNEVDPYIFYNRVRNFLSGWKGNPLLPDGMLYEGISEIPQSIHGASAAQSSLIAAFDVFFNVKHDSEQTHEFINEMRRYMPLKHRQFLEMLAKHAHHLNDYINKFTSSENELRQAYSACIDQLVEFRNKHIQIVALYILAQMRKNNNNPNSSEQENDDASLATRGTGGTILMPFLKTCRDETKLQREKH
ncbi:hypothetical protein I4U23_023344 [Adineta vaga]|nr:hypothetical protein I4U23_023344 [Adineta vaga]